MTNEEAINTINSLKQYYNDKNEDSYVGFDNEDNEALEIAIEALETASCIKEKCAYCPHCKNCDVDDETLAIKALEQQPCEDAISREETILHISERLYETAMNNQGYEITMDKACEDIALDRLKTWINELPSVKPQRAKGHWISYTDHQACSCCGKWIAYYADYNYCSNCGADMRGDKE